MSTPDDAGPTAVAAPGGAGAGPVPALELVHVSAAYGPYRALFDVSFTVPAGGIVALLGANGAGKSTVVRVVSGLLPATGGTVSVGGRPVTGAPAYRIARAGLAHVPEGRGVFANLSVEENLVLSFRQRAGAAAVRGALASAYESFPVLGERRRQRAGTLSGGQQRLLSLAKVLVVPPALLVADELSLGLAPGVVDAVYDGLRRIHQAGAALLVVEQQLDRVLEVADRAVVLQRGSVAFDGPAEDAVAAAEQVLAESGHEAPMVAGWADRQSGRLRAGRTSGIGRTGNGRNGDGRNASGWTGNGRWRRRDRRSSPPARDRGGEGEVGGAQDPGPW